MDDALILAELEAQARSLPGFINVSAIPMPYIITNSDYRWIGHTVALLHQWDSVKAIPVRVAGQNLQGPLFDQNVGIIRVALYEAIADLKLRVRQKPGGAFAASAVYDFFREFKNVISLADKELFVIDPYLNEEIFTYLSFAGLAVKFRLLMKEPKLIAAVRMAQSKFNEQYDWEAETRETKDIHDRVVTATRSRCWPLGKSGRYPFLALQRI